ncbi:MAG: amidase family protein [Anaerorhabdus sp.]
MKLYKTHEEIKKEIELVLEKIKEENSIINAVVNYVDTEDQINGVNLQGKLSGVSTALKDNISTKGTRTTASSKILENYIPIYDATVTKKLKDAGAIIVAKASMDELGMGGTNKTALTGPVLNPWDTSRITGGSSGGSAALVASGAVQISIGTDTGDSIRKPAAYCGIVGVKPTYGRISRYGVIPYASSLDHVGYFTTSVNDAAIALEVLAGRDDKDMTSSFEEVQEYSALLKDDIKGKVVGILDNVIEATKDVNIKSQFNELIVKLEEKGAIIKKIKLNQDLLRAVLPTYYLIANCEATANHANLDSLRFGSQAEGDSAEEIMMNSRTEGFGLYLRKRFMVGSYGLFIENQDKLFRKAQKVRRLIVEDLKNSMENVDAIIAIAGGVAPKLDASLTDAYLSDEHLVAENYMIVGNFSGYPSMTLPLGFKDGCPIGVNLMSKPFMELDMFNIALTIEGITGLKDQTVEVKK